MSAKKKLLYKKRAAIEAKISEGKRMTGLANLTIRDLPEIRCGRVIGTCAKPKAAS